jgi:vancomycin resistance protein YoaR
VAILGAFLVLPGLFSADTIKDGVTIGEVDVSNMTREEAASALASYYNPRINEGKAIIYASKEAADSSLDIEKELAESDAQAEQLSLEEARANKKLWVAEARTLGAHLDTDELVEKAYQVGRDEGFLAVFGVGTKEKTISPTLDFDEDALENLVSDIEETVGAKRVDYYISIEEGEASLAGGSTGTAIDLTQFRNNLTSGFLSDQSSQFSFVAEPTEAALRVSLEDAQKTLTLVQDALNKGLTFTFENQSWNLDAAALGDFVKSRVNEDTTPNTLVAYLDENTLCDYLNKQMNQAGYVSAATISFTNNNGDIEVTSAAGSKYAHLSEAIQAANNLLFPESSTLQEGDLAVAIEWGDAPEKTSFDDALQTGLISVISSFTTEYTDSVSTATRRHNIHQAADLLNNSIVPANNGTWSFNNVVGEATVESGFQAAHAIINGEYDDAIGGGICQVATTVFNAVYNAGYPVKERHNHSLYISSYPTGRDAAIAYPDLDLIWENDTTSDVLVKATYTDSSITVTLYGINPGYVVTTKTGDWEEGEAYQKITRVDDSEPEGTSYVKTVGANGRSVTVHRTVRDRAGNIIHEEDFSSNYAPINEVTIVGPSSS